MASSCRDVLCCLKPPFLASWRFIVWFLCKFLGLFAVAFYAAQAAVLMYVLVKHPPPDNVLYWLFAIPDAITCLFWLYMLVYPKFDMHSTGYLWSAWLLYSVFLAAKLIPIFIYIAKNLNSSDRHDLGANWVKATVGGTSMVFLCLVLANEHCHELQCCKGKQQEQQQQPDAGQRTTGIVNHSYRTNGAEGSVSLDIARPPNAGTSSEASLTPQTQGHGNRHAAHGPDHTMGRVSNNVVVDLFDNSEFLDMLFMDGRYVHKDDESHDMVDSLSGGLAEVMAVCGAVSFLLPTIALVAVGSRRRALAADKRAGEAPPQGCDSGNAPGAGDRESQITIDHDAEFIKYKLGYLFASMVANLAFLVMRIIAWKMKNGKVGIFIAKNIVFLILYAIEFCETLHEKMDYDKKK
ncbi:uncharacterized protein LOC135819727 [Sycon ciliatum]|uniref:uncharacterized protein LOC135819727 n=1 Tax=Sycon ciliatum TaxID=27933 RepID=UPI0031F6FE76